MNEQPSLPKIINNTLWLFADRAIGIVTGLLIGAWVARYLGPEQLGTYSYAIAFVAILAPFCRLGLRDIVIRDSVKHPSEQSEILGTNFVLQQVASIATIVIAISIASITNEGDALTIAMIAIISLGLLFLPFNHTAEVWFHAQVQAKYFIWSRNAVLIITSAIKVGLILTGASLISFAWVVLFGDIMLTGMLLLTYYFSGVKFLNWRFTLDHAKKLLRDSLPLMFAVFASAIYLRVDQLMLGQMVSRTELGYYSAAVKLSELWYFIPAAIAASVFPSIIRSRRDRGPEIYGKRVQLLYDVLVLTSYVIVIPLVLLATPVVVLLYGQEFAPSGEILTIHAWAFVFIAIGVARSRWLIAENLVYFTLAATGIGAIINLAINFVLIPTYGGIGAAWATVIAYAVANYFTSLITVRSRLAFRQSTMAILAPVRLLINRPDPQNLF